MKRKLRFFDFLSFFGALCLLFTVGFHLGLGKREKASESLLVSLRLETASVNNEDGELLIDGKYGCSVVGISDGVLFFECSGVRTEAGFLLSGAKYICKNQPLEMVGDRGRFYGRIASVEKILKAPR